MDWIQVITALISAASVIIVARINVDSRRHMKKSEEREKIRNKGTLIQLKMMQANTKLTDAIAIAIKRGYPNGEVEAAQKEIAEVEKEYNQFMIEMTAKNLSKY